MKNDENLQISSIFLQFSRSNTPKVRIEPRVSGKCENPIWERHKKTQPKMKTGK